MPVSKHGYTKDVVCPYYKYEAPQMVYCEGVEPNTALHLAFAAKADKKTFMEQKCRCSWKKCLIAQMLNRKWDYE
jgi:hypothetical protein